MGYAGGPAGPQPIYPLREAKATKAPREPFVRVLWLWATMFGGVAEVKEASRPGGSNWVHRLLHRGLIGRRHVRHPWVIPRELVVMNVEEMGRLQGAAAFHPSVQGGGCIGGEPQMGWTSVTTMVPSDDLRYLILNLSPELRTTRVALLLWQ